MGRKSSYDALVKPYLKDIEKWMTEYTEAQIARKLGISPISFIRYKKEHKDLQEAVARGLIGLKECLKTSLKKRAQGYYYEESERKVTKNGDKEEIVEKTTRRYAHPDVAAIHLLLKNIDPEWHNDDIETIKNRRKQLELDERRVENNEY